MSDEHNPKAYYNQSEYASNPKRHPSAVMYKPDEPGLQPDGPPPPYSSPSSVSSPPTTSAASSSQPGPFEHSSGDYRTYGTLSGQPGLLDPAKSYMDRQPPSPGLPGTPPKQQPVWNNPHIPRELAGQSRHGSLPSTSSRASRASRPSRHVPDHGDRRSDADDDDDDNNMGERGCCRGKCKFFVLVVLVWLVILKYSGSIHIFPTPSDPNNLHVCNGLTTVEWQDGPQEVAVEKDVTVIVKGRVTTGKAIVRSLPDNSRGSVGTQVYVSPPSLRDQLSYEFKDGREAQLELRFPDTLPPNACIAIAMDITLSDKAEVLSITSPQTTVEFVDDLYQKDRVEIHTTNAAIRARDVKADQLILQTTNGPIVVANTEGDSVRLQSSNAALRVGTLAAKDTIVLQTSDGEIEAGALQADASVTATTANGGIKVASVVTDRLIATTSNGRALLEHISSPDVSIVTSNELLEAHVAGPKDGRVELGTSNAPVTLHMTTSFEGGFLVRTSSNQQATVEDLQDHVVLRMNRRNEKQGTRLKGDGLLTVSTSNQQARLVFDI